MDAADPNKAGDQVWHNLEDIDADAPSLITIGFLVKESKTAIVIASTVDTAEPEDDEHDAVAGSMLIPRGAIVKMRQIRSVK